MFTARAFPVPAQVTPSGSPSGYSASHTAGSPTIELDTVALLSEDAWSPATAPASPPMATAKMNPAAKASVDSSSWVWPVATGEIGLAGDVRLAARCLERSCRCSRQRGRHASKPRRLIDTSLGSHVPAAGRSTPTSLDWSIGAGESVANATPAPHVMERLATTPAAKIRRKWRDLLIRVSFQSHPATAARWPSTKRRRRKPEQTALCHRPRAFYYATRNLTPSLCVVELREGHGLAMIDPLLV